MKCGNKNQPNRRKRSGLTIIELLIAIAIIAVVLVVLRLQNVASMNAFDRSRNNLSGVWMSNLIMNELMSAELPNFELELDGEDAQALVEGQGNVGEFLEKHYPEMWQSMDESRQLALEEWKYQYSKMVFMISEDEQGGPDKSFIPYLDEENYEDPSDSELEDPDYIDPNDRLAKPTARVIRIMLVLTPPHDPKKDVPDPPSLVAKVPIFGGEGSIPDLDREQQDPRDLDREARAERTAERRAHYVMIRFIDPSNLQGSLTPTESTEGSNQ